MERLANWPTRVLLLAYALAHALLVVSLLAFGILADGWVLHPVGVAWYGLFVLAGLMLLGRAWRSEDSPWPLVIPPLLALAALGAFPVSPMLGGARYQPYDPGDLHEVFIILQFLFTLAGCGLALIYRWPRLLVAWAGAQGMLLITYPVWWARMARWGNLATPLPVGAMVLGAPLLYAVAALALGWWPSRSWAQIALVGLGAGLVLVAGTAVAHWRYLGTAGFRPEFARQSWLFFAVQVPLILGFAAIVLPLPLYARQAAREWGPGEAPPRGSLWPAVAFLVWTATSLFRLVDAGFPAAGADLGWAGVTVPDAWLPTRDWARWLVTAVRWLLIPYALLVLLTGWVRLVLSPEGDWPERVFGVARRRWTRPTFPRLLLWTGLAWLAVFAFYSPIPWLSMGGWAGVGFVLWTVWDSPGSGMMFLPLLGGLGLIACARAWELGRGAEERGSTGAGEHEGKGASEPSPHPPIPVLSVVEGSPSPHLPISPAPRPLGPTAQILWGVATVALLLTFLAWQGRVAWAYGRVLFAPLPAWSQRWQYAPVDPTIASAVGLVLHLALAGLGLSTLRHTIAAWWPAGGLARIRLLGETEFRPLTALPLALAALTFGLWWWATTPAVIRTVPSNGAADVPRDTVVLIEMAPRSWPELLLRGSGMGVRTRYADTGDHIPGASGGSGTGFFFHPQGLLRPNALVEVVVQRTGERPYVLRFTTAGVTGPTATPMPGFPPFAEPTVPMPIPTPAPPPTATPLPSPTPTPPPVVYRPTTSSSPSPSPTLTSTLPPPRTPTPPVTATPRATATPTAAATSSPTAKPPAVRAFPISAGLGRLAFVDAQSTLWIADLATGSLTRLDDQASGPRWSPDGRWLHYGRGHETWRVLANGSRPPQPAPYGVWSPRGDRLAWPTADGALWASVLEGEPYQVLPPGSLGDDGRGTVVWSSDGWLAWSLTTDQLAAARQREQTLYVRPAEKEAEVTVWRLSNVRRTYYQLIDWVPGTRLILAGRGLMAVSLWTWGMPLVTINADTGKITELGAAMLLTSESHAWHPTQPGLLALAEGRNRYLNYTIRLALLDVTTGELRTLTSEEMTAFEPAWSPDGTLLAYAAVSASPNATGDGETLEHTLDGRAIYVVNPQNGEIRALTHPGDAVDSWPQWSADGTRLLYTRQHDGYTDVRVVTLDGSRDELLVTGLADPMCYYGGCGWRGMLAYYSGATPVPPTATPLLATATPTPPPTPTTTRKRPTPTVPSTASPGTTERVSVASDGKQGNGSSSVPSISADGRYVAFASTASNLVPGDSSTWDVFVHDRHTGETERISEARDGTRADADSFSPVISADGRWVAFWSFASNLVPGDTQLCGTDGTQEPYNCGDIFVYDREPEEVERIAVGGIHALGTYHDLSISGDGRYVAFAAWPSNLTDEHSNIFVYDRQTDKIYLVSVSSSGMPGNAGTYAPRISADGRWIAFASNASNLVAEDTNEVTDVFVYDRQTGQTERVSIASDGTQANDASGLVPQSEGVVGGLSISADGRYVAFTSKASNLVAGDTNECEAIMHLSAHPCYDIFVHDRETGKTERVSIASDGTQADGDSLSPSISADGRWVAFTSYGSNLVANDTNDCFRINCPDIFVHDRQTGTTERVSITSDGGQSNGWSSGTPAISADGRWVAFSSEASNLVPSDTNKTWDVFVRDHGESEEAVPIGQPDQVRHISSPDGQWTALWNETAGSLDVQGPDGKTFPVFPPNSTVDTATWSPDSRHLLIVRANWQRSQPGAPIEVSGPVEIWRVRLESGRVRLPELVFRPEGPPDTTGGPGQIALGRWSPNSRYVLFWLGPLSASILADGLPLRVLDVETGQVTSLADGTLLNPRYQSWAPDSSALAFTAGGYRSAQVNKWLNLFDVASGQVTTVVSKTEQIPGIVAWSPRGDLIAYAAVPAAETGPDLADWMSFENAAIAGRRVYLLDPTTGQRRRLNDAGGFQDAPTWSDDGAILYYVQREGDIMALMAADPATGQAQMVEGSRRPAPRAVGYYGQSKWDDLLAYRPEAPRALVPPLTETYTDPTHGYTLRYPAGWHVGQGWRSLYGWHAMPTLSSYPPDPSAGSGQGLGPFSGQALVAIEVVEVPEDGIEALLQQVQAASGPGQILGRDRLLMAFDERGLTVEGRPAVRLETMGDFGAVNHVLVVLDRTRGFILRGRGDGRVFDAVAGSLRLR